MKHRIKNYLKLGIFIFGISFLLINCEYDEEVQKPQTTAKNQLPFKLNEKSFQELSKDPTFSRAINQLVSKKIKGSALSSRTVMEEQYGFTIDSTTINELVFDNFTSYTMLINRENSDTTFFENLVVVIDSTNISTATIVKYTLNSEIMPSTDNSFILDAEMELTSIDYDATQAKGETPCGWVLMCSYGGSHAAGAACLAAAADGDPREFSQGWAGDCGESEGGGGWGSSQGSNPSGDTYGNTGSPYGGIGGGGIGIAPIPPVIKTPEELVLDCLGITESNIGVLTPEMHDWINLVNCAPADIQTQTHTVIQLSNYISNNGCNDETIDLLIDVLDALVNDEVETLEEYLQNIDCIKLKELFEDDVNNDNTVPNIKPIIQQLETTLGYAGENGVNFNQNNDATATTSNTFSNPSLIPNPNNSVDIPTQCGNTVSSFTTYGGAHTHPDDNYPMFSFSDLLVLSKLYTCASSSLKNSVFFTLTARPLPGMIPNTYAIKIKDLSKLSSKIVFLRNKAVSKVPSITTSSTNKMVERGINQLLKKEFEQSINLERAFLDFFNDSGISLYRANETLDNWVELLSDPLSSPYDPNSVYEQPCN